MVIGLSAMSAFAQDDARSAYDRLDTRRLLEHMRQLGMSELQEALLTRSGDADTREGKLRRVDLLITRGVQTADLDRRNAMIDEALQLLGEVVDSIDPSASAADKTAKFRLKFDRAWKTIDLRAGPYIERLQTLQGGPADREEILRITKEPAREVRYLLEHIQDAIEAYSGPGVSAKDFIDVVPPLRNLLLELKYRSGFAFYFRAIALDPTADAKERNQLLNDALGGLQEFAQEPDTYGVMYDAMLMAGRCLREKGDVEAALPRFVTIADTHSVATPTRVAALFEIPRLLAEQNRFQEAMSGLEKFIRDATYLAGKTFPEDIDLRISLLGHYIYQRQADQASGAAKADLELRAQQSLMRFVDRHPDIKSAYYKIIAKKYRHLEDTPEQAGSLALLAMADGEVVKAREAETEQAKDEHLTKGSEMLGMALGRTDPASEMLRKEMRKLKLLIDAMRGDALTAAKEALALAKQLVQEDPASAEGGTMAENAVRLTDQVVYERESVGEAVPHEFRTFFVEAITTMLGNDAWLQAKPERRLWYFDLAWNYQQLAGESPGDEGRALYLKAAEAYERMPDRAGGRDYARQHMDALFRGLEIRLFLLTTADEPDADTAQALRNRLRQYGNDAMLRMQQAEANGQAEFRRQLAQWGSEAEFRAAELYYDPLGSASGAVSELAGLPQRWADTDVLARSAELEIRVLIDSGRVDEAVVKLNAFMDAYPDQAQELVRLVVEQVRKSINDIRYDEAKKPKLDQRRKDYHKLARILFESVQSAPLEDRYRQTQMYAEALNEIGQSEEALALFEACHALGEVDRIAQTDTFTVEYTARLTALDEAEQAEDPVATLKALADSARTELVDAGYGEDFTDTVEIDEALAELAEAEGDTARQSAKRLLARALRNVYRRMKDRKIATIPIDPTNLLGLARCYMALDRADDGMVGYADLVAKTDPKRLPVLHWDMRLEWAWATLEAYRDNADVLKGLIGNIRQNRFQTRGAMGGRADAFDRIERQAIRRLAELGQPWSEGDD